MGMLTVVWGQPSCSLSCFPAPVSGRKGVGRSLERNLSETNVVSILQLHKSVEAELHGMGSVVKVRGIIAHKT